VADRVIQVPTGSRGRARPARRGRDAGTPGGRHRHRRERLPLPDRRRGQRCQERGVFDLNERYDPISNAWHSHEPLPLAMHGITGAAFLDGWIYVPGGATRRGVRGQDVTLKLQTFRADANCTPPA
jgi:hypothetical protein